MNVHSSCVLLNEWMNEWMQRTLRPFLFTLVSLICHLLWFNIISLSKFHFTLFHLSQSPELGHLSKLWASWRKHLKTFPQLCALFFHSLCSPQPLSSLWSLSLWSLSFLCLSSPKSTCTTELWVPTTLVWLHWKQQCERCEKRERGMSGWDWFIITIVNCLSRIGLWR